MFVLSGKLFRSSIGGSVAGLEEMDDLVDGVVIWEKVI
jgi:hypothetical protein